MAKRRMRFNWQVFLMASAGVVFLLVFAYLPMFGIVVAFKDLDHNINIMKGLMEKPFVGFANFMDFFRDRQFKDIMFNTLGLNLLSLAIGFPIPVLFALLLNEVRADKLRKTIQAVTCFPHFVSWAIFGGIVLSMISADGGILNDFLVAVGILEKPIAFASRAQYFWGIAIFSGLVKGMGWGSIIYLAAIAGVNQEIYQSATLDGANRAQTAWHVTLPCIAGTITVMLLLSVSGILGNSFDQIYMLQNPLNLSRSEVLVSFVYKVGITQRRYSYTTAVGIFTSVVALVLLSTSHFMSKKISGRGLF